MNQGKLFEDIASTLDLFFQEASITELRILDSGRGTVSGYFNDIGKLASVVTAWDNNKKGQIYFIPNPLNPKLLARSCNHLTEFAKHTTTDADVLMRHWWLVDFDPIRPSGISATASEHESALAMSKEVGRFLRTLGWPDAVFSDSGNGAHLCYTVNLPNDTSSQALLKRCLEALDFQFSDEKVQVDVGTYNAARLIRLYGTVSRKGDSLPERPHRRTKIIYKPKTIQSVSLEQLEALAIMNPQRRQQQ